MTANKKIKDAILKYFSRKGTIPGDNEQQKLEFDYLKYGFIDSMGIVEMISDFEAMFKVSFEQKHFDSPKFSTIKGLVEIIEDMKEQATD